MKSLMQRIWNFEFNSDVTIVRQTRLIEWFIWLVAVGFAIFTVFFVGYYSPQDYFKSLTGSGYSIDNFRALLPHIWFAIALLAVVMRATIIIHSYYLSKKKLGEIGFNQFFSTYISTFFLGAATALVITFISGVLYLTGYDFNWISHLVNSGILLIENAIIHYVPYSLGIKSYGLALFLSILLASLPGYCVHLLSHKSRLIWLMAHRAHHCPDFLHPLAAPNNNLTIIEILLGIPGLIFFAVVSKLIYHEPLVVEMAIWFTMRLCFESFNHSSIHYDFALRNPIVRNACRLFGDTGVYHLVHHSAYKRDQNVNFSISPFMIWDRIFGTYRKPYEQEPPLGLTDQPKISLSPFKIVFSGFSQLVYEWKMNKDFSTRFKIIFSGVYYKPPITKDFLILNN